MIIDVALSPASPVRKADAVVVVDVLRASSTITSALDRGADDVIVADAIEEALRLKARHPDRLLCGEREGRPPPGFDHGNSPLELSALDLRGRRLILATANGTPLLHRYAGTRVLLAGSLRNAAAVVGAAVSSIDREESTLLIACAGLSGSGRASLEDTFTAGAMVGAAALIVGDASLRDEARIALDVYRSYEGDGLRAFGESSHGRYLASIGYEDDLDYCAALDASHSVPVARLTDGILHLGPLR
ncbi:MAG: 2-phosphosulfolactate phosphatase [Dehalococcoidia bacterium]|nr:2-phosphosulfolactate phosphatase [Dehalococcoidia bacterium]